MTYPTSPDWNAGRFYGPLSQATVSFPDASPSHMVYVTLAEFQRWQLEATLENDQAAAAAYDAAASTMRGYGVSVPPNPYAVGIATVAAQLAALPPLG